MTKYNSSALAWGIGISVYEVALLVTSLAIISIKKMLSLFGALMTLYVVVMLSIGASMYLGLAPFVDYVINFQVPYCYRCPFPIPSPSVLPSICLLERSKPAVNTKNLSASTAFLVI
jgi:hypothetical protein